MLLSLYCIGFIVTASFAFNSQNVKSTLERPVYSSQEEISEKDRALLAYVNFECTGRPKGYYADQEFDCYVFHYCDDYHKRYSYKCKGGKRFDQETAKCKSVLNSRCRGGVVSQNKTTLQRDYLFSSNKVSTSERRSSYSSHNSDQDLEALSAFASLTVKPDIRNTKFNDNKPKSTIPEVKESLSPPGQRNSQKTGRKQDTYFPLYPNSYSVYDITIPSPSPSVAGEIKKSKFLPSSSEKFEKVAQASNNQRFYENYYPYSNSEGQRQSPVFATTPFPVFHSVPPIDKSFNHFQNLAREIEPINIKFNSHVDRPIADQSFISFPKSHFNFSPPGSSLTLKHSNIRAPLGGIVHPPPLKRPDSFHNTDSFKPINKKPKPPSIFASPSPPPVFTSPSPPHFPKSHHPSFPEPFNRNPFGNLLRHDPPALYRNPLPYQHLQFTPNYNLYGNIPYTLGPPLGISNINSFPHPNAGIKSDAIHPQNLPIKKSHKAVKIPNQENKQGKVNNILPSDIDNQFNKEEKRILPKTPIPEVKESPENADYENVKLKNKPFSNVNRERLQNKLRTGSRIRSKSKLIKDKTINTVSEDVKEPSRSNLEQNTPTSTRPPKEISPSRSLRRKTLRNKIKSSEEPKIDEKTSTVSTLDISDFNDEKLEVNYDVQGADLAEEISTTASTITTAKPSTDVTKPYSPRGSLKDRLNRLTSRRRISGQGKIGSRTKELLKPNTPSKTKEIVQEKKPPPVRLRSRKFPTFKREESDNDTLTTPTTSERLKSRVSNFHKERSQSRIRPQRPLRKRIEEEKIIKKEEKEAIETNEKINEQTTQENSGSISKETTETPSEIQSTEIVETINEKETSTEGKRKRKMSPDVRARFKEFLKNRRRKTKTEDDSPKSPELNKENTEVKTEELVIEIKETPSPLVSTDKTNSSVFENETVDEVEFIADESTTMEKSVPLVREEKVIVLNKENENPFNRGDKKMPEALYRPKAAYTYSPQSIFSHSSGKPFRYLLNKIVNRKGTQHPYFHSRKQVVLRKNHNDQKESSSTASPSITEHKVVTPSNFKQIVRMHPRNPNNEIYKNVTLQEPIQDDTRKETQTPSYNENEVYIVDVSKSKENKKPNESKQTLTPNITFEEPLLKGSNLELTDNDEEEEEDTRVSKPVFNLDSITYRTNDKVSHISALDTNDYREKIGSIKFEPFATANGKPLLPIEKLYKLSK